MFKAVSFLIFALAFCSLPAKREYNDISEWNQTQAISDADIQLHSRTSKLPLIKSGRVYLIFFGDRWTIDQQKFVHSFVDGLGNSSWFNILRRNYKITSMMTRVSWNATSTYKSSFKFTDNTQIWDVIVQTLKYYNFELCADCIYVFLADDKVSNVRVCDTSCGYHSAMTVNGVVYSFINIQNPNKCAKKCISEHSSPNGDLALDFLVNILAHELAEALTDPDTNTGYSWTDPSNDFWEVADICAYQYGDVQKNKHGANYNMVLKGKQYLIQQIWDQKSRKCMSK